MKLVVVFCLIAVVAAAPSPYYNAIVLRYENVNPGTGYYRYAYELDNGSKAQQEGQLKKKATGEESLAVSGTFEWIAPSGRKYTVTYTADEEGYKPQVEEGEGPGALPSHCVATLCG